jgi:hypothetical protein
MPVASCRAAAYILGTVMDLRGEMKDAQARPAVLLLEEHSADGSRWLEDVQQQFELKRVVTVIGTRRSQQDGALAAVILQVSSPETRSATLVRMLRGQPGLQDVPFFLLAPAPVEPIAQTLGGLPNVEVLDVTRAHLTLCARIAGASGTTRREERKRPETPRNTPVPAPTTNKTEDLHTKLQRRFLMHSAERSQRALTLCDELRAPNATSDRRRAMLDEIKDLLNVMKGEATLLRLRAVAEVLNSAETIVSRFEDTRRSISVPRGVLGLLSDLAGLGGPQGSIAALDVDLHRLRLNAAEEGAHGPRNPQS